MTDRPKLPRRRISMSRRAALGFLGGVTVGMSQATANSGTYFDDYKPLIEDIGAAERIKAADALRTIIQETAAAACFLHHNIEPEESRASLEVARKAYHRNRDALLFGNLSMNIIGEETHRATRDNVARLDTAWGDIDSSVAKLLDAPADKTALTALRTRLDDTFPITEELVGRIAGQYSNPAELLQRHAILIDIAGRQGRLTQRIADQACNIWTSEQSALAKSALRAAMDTYELSLNGLRDGLPHVGLPAAPSEAIVKELDALLTDWSDTKAMLNEMLNRETFTEEARATLFRRTTETTRRLENVTKMYVSAAKTLPQ